MQIRHRPSFVTGKCTCGKINCSMVLLRQEILVSRKCLKKGQSICELYEKTLVLNYSISFRRDNFLSEFYCVNKGLIIQISLLLSDKSRK
jgi:hypothetical protein